jgi:hypothetical protein
MRSNAKYVAACPKWVASYGVIPHTYMRNSSDLAKLINPADESMIFKGGKS